MAAPVWETHTTANNSATSLTANKPTGTVEGDLLVAVVNHKGSVEQTITPPSGWASIEKNTSQRFSLIYTTEVFYKIAGASEPSTYQFSWVNSNFSTLAIVRISGVDGTTPINASETGKTAGDGETTPDCPTVTTTVAETLVLRIIGGISGGSARTITEPSGTTLRIDLSSGASGADRQLWATEEQATAGATGVATWTISSTDNAATFTVAIAPAEGAGNSVIEVNLPLLGVG